MDRYPPRSGCDKYGKEIREIIDAFDLIDTVRCLFPQRNDLFTWHQGSSASRIDKIIV